MAISRLTRQWRQQKLQLNLSQKRKTILQYGFFCSLLFFMFKTFLFLVFCANLPLRKFKESDITSSETAAQRCS